MLFNAPDIARCLNCRALFLVELANIVGELPALPRAPERSWRVTLCETGTSRVNVMAVLRKHLAINMSQAKQMVTALPALVASGKSTINDGTELIQDLLAVGATATHDVTDEELNSCQTSIPTAWTAAPSLPPLQELDFLEAVGSSLWSDRQSEIRLRTAALHSGNDLFRQAPAAWQPLTHRHPLAAANALALFGLLAPEAPAENLLRAELARELARFDDALTIALATNLGELLTHERIAAELIARAQRSDSALFSIDLADE